MSIAIKKTCEIIKKLRETQSKSWLEIQHEVEAAAIKQGSFEPLYVGYEGSPYGLRFVPQKQPQIISRKFDEELNRIGKEHSLACSDAVHGLQSLQGHERTGWSRPEDQENAWHGS